MNKIISENFSIVFFGGLTNPIFRMFFLLGYLQVVFVALVMPSYGSWPYVFISVNILLFILQLRKYLKERKKLLKHETLILLLFMSICAVSFLATIKYYILNNFEKSYKINSELVEFEETNFIEFYERDSSNYHHFLKFHNVIPNRNSFQLDVENGWRKSIVLSDSTRITFIRDYHQSHTGAIIPKNKWTILLTDGKYYYRSAIYVKTKDVSNELDGKLLNQKIQQVVTELQEQINRINEKNTNHKKEIIPLNIVVYSNIMNVLNADPGYFQPINSLGRTYELIYNLIKYLFFGILINWIVRETNDKLNEQTEL